MIIVRKTSTRTVFSSSWSRRKQAEMLDEWQIMALQVLNTYEIAARRYTALPLKVSRQMRTYRRNAGENAYLLY